MGQKTKALAYHELENEYQFELPYVHQSGDQTVCQQMMVVKTFHTPNPLSKQELGILGHQWVDDLPMTIKVGNDRLRPLTDLLSFNYSYINSDGNRVTGVYE
jgi:hypothetical protein